MRLEKSDEIVSALGQIAENEGLAAAWVRGVGTIEGAELVSADSIAEGDFRIISLEGTLLWVDERPRWSVNVAMVDSGDERGTVFGGKLRRAFAVGVDLVIEVLDEVGAQALTHPTPSDDPTPAAVSWADVADVSEARQEAPPARPSLGHSPLTAPARSAPPMHEARPTKGDFIQHRQFGLCRVDREEGGIVHIRLPSGIRKKISLAHMDVGQPRDQGGKTVYAVRPRRD